MPIGFLMFTFLEVCLIVTVAVCLAAAIAFILDEEYDAKTNPEHGLKWSDLFKRSHETVIFMLIVLAVVFAAAYATGLA